jgi:hypothetical protein
MTQSLIFKSELLIEAHFTLQSILAIWLHWIVPMKTEEPKQVVRIPSRNREQRRKRLSAPPRLQSLPSVPTRPAIIHSTSTQSEGNRRQRRVYFSDETPPPPTPPKVDPILLPLPEDSSETSEETSLVVSAVEPGAAVPIHHVLLRRETYEDSIVESDTSSRRSSLCKIKSPFNSKLRTHRRSPSPASLPSVLDSELGMCIKPVVF